MDWRLVILVVPDVHGSPVLSLESSPVRKSRKLQWPPFSAHLANHLSNSVGMYSRLSLSSLGDDTSFPTLSPKRALKDCTTRESGDIGKATQWAPIQRFGA